MRLLLPNWEPVQVNQWVVTLLGMADFPYVTPG
jgi:hypothetical protein